MEDASILDKVYDGAKRIFSYNARELHRLDGIVEQVNSYEEDMSALLDDKLAGKTDEFRERYADGESLDDLLPEAYAAVREASRRVTGMRPYDVQVLGGVVLHEGRIAEMATGEGKTLVATMPAYLHAIEGKGVHVVTANDYLAGRDAEEMGSVYEFMGLSVGVIQHEMKCPERRENYKADITYGTANEIGFDYLKTNNMVKKAEDKLLRGTSYAIIDEVDSILIDEARTPLIISGKTGVTPKEFQFIDYMVRGLKEGEDFEVEEKEKRSFFTDEGYSKLTGALGVQNLTDTGTVHLYQAARQVLQAQTLFTKDKDYVVQDGDVRIVDEFTGRVIQGRRYDGGLHEALEAKEANNQILEMGFTEVEVKEPTRVLASVTFPNFFRAYDRIAGMTGTAKTEEGELLDIYGMDVLQIPTNRPLQRTAGQDRLYRTVEEKYDAVVDDIVATHESDRPVLVGTRSIDVSEHLSDMLDERGIEHQVLHAKYHEKEAEIVAKAGLAGVVTIATNMAGRGTDIKLGEGLADLGGLHVIGTERHESRRIDDQLLGRAGRQGDPGSSQFYVSAEDELIRFYGPENIDRLFKGVHRGEPVSGKFVDKVVRNAQRTVEGMHYDMRKELLELDETMNSQRKVLYADRNEILTREDMKDTVYGFIDQVTDQVVDAYTAEGDRREQWEDERLQGQFASDLQTLYGLKPDDLSMQGVEDREGLRSMLKERVFDMYHQQEGTYGEPAIRQIERQILLFSTDKAWREHLQAMDELKMGIHLRSFAQKDPKVEYKIEAFDLYREMQGSVRREAVGGFFQFKLDPKGDAPADAGSA